MSSSPLPPLSGNCGTPTSGEKEVRLNAAALSDPDSLLISVSFPSFPSIFTKGLVDSGSSHCFVDSSYAISNSLPIYDIPPVSLRLIDGSFGTIITQALDLSIRFTTGDILPVKFYVTKLDPSVAFVFGYNWLHRYNPSIDWFAGRLLSFR